LLIIKLIQIYFEFSDLVQSTIPRRLALLFDYALICNCFVHANLVLPVRIGLRERQFTPPLSKSNNVSLLTEKLI